MKTTRLIVPALSALLSAAPAAADITLKSKASGKGMVGAIAGDMTQYLKGTRTRTDQTTGGRQTSTIIDAATQKMIVLDHEKKQAEVIDMTAIGNSMAKAGMADVNVTITPRTETRQIAGTACQVYDLKVVVPMQMGNGGMTMVMSGPQCLAKNAPGHADFMAFYKAASEKGFFLDPNQARAQPAAAKAMADMQRKMAELGVPLPDLVQMLLVALRPHEARLGLGAA